MRTETPVTIRLKDYKQPDYWIKETHLVIRIFDNFTQVESTLSVELNGEADVLPPLALDGVEQDIKDIYLDGNRVLSFDYDQYKLTVQPDKPKFEFKAVTHIRPNENTSLEGLYKSGSMYCTQCEAEGFRKITFYLDRPDVMSVFTTRIEADKKDYPTLLANGNPIESGDLEDDRHFATWHDPFLKPAYLFACVAGNLVRKDDMFTTASGREVSVRIFAEPRNAHKVDFALDSLKRSMKWDEEKFGREYDLDIFMIVASDYFNMGAMENKGLNIFNSAAVLATPDTTSDAHFERIEAIVAHEYFHNWSGNRVTCRDWFQLSLKEGFTVFRDAEFTADMHDRTVKRIKDVSFLKNHQFPEDSGPNAHPVQPQEYMEINNFYTVTIYEKGAEVVGMLKTLVGEELFRQGSDRYFERFDGMAVTTEDFVACMEEVSGKDFTQFKRWYVQAGTPIVDVTESYDQAQQTYQLTFKQHCKPTPGQNDKLPFVIPVKMALLDREGNECSINCDGDFNSVTNVLTLTEAETLVTFKGLPEKPVASLFRDFSAPVRVNFSRSEWDELFVAEHDSNAFNRFDAIQSLYQKTIFKLLDDSDAEIPETIKDVVNSVLADNSLSYALKAVMLELPQYQVLLDNLEQVDAENLIIAREKLLHFIAVEFKASWKALTHDLASADDYQFNAAETGRRELQFLALANWAKSGDDEALVYAEALYRAANNQTDRQNGLRAVIRSQDKHRKQSLLKHAYQSWQHDTQLVELWFSMQAGSEGADVGFVEALMKHEAFEMTNPNKVRSVLGGFAQNFKSFHDVEGRGYQLAAKVIIELNTLNPLMAARFVKVLENWRKFEPKRADMMRAALQQVLTTESLSTDVMEMAQKALG